MKAVRDLSAPSASATRGPLQVLGGLVVATRPKQWLKNLLVAAAPVAAGKILVPHVAWVTLLAGLAFVAISSAVYLINDVADRAHDAQHPVKRFRPIAAGIVPVAVAMTAAVVLGSGGLALAWFATNGATAAIVAGYAVMSLAYSARLKHEPILDIGVVAAGFVLRAVAGGVAAHVFISRYFLLVAGFGALFVVASKRYAELAASAGSAGARSVLGSYSSGFLNLTRTLAATVTVVTYCFWAFERASLLHHSHLILGLSIVPFTLAVLRYALLVEHGDGEAPEDLIVGDRALVGLGIVWLALVGGGIFLG